MSVCNRCSLVPRLCLNFLELMFGVIKNEEDKWGGEERRKEESHVKVEQW